MSLKRLSLLVALSSVVACGKNVCNVDSMSGEGGVEVGQRIYFEFDRPKPGQKAQLNADQKELVKATTDIVKNGSDMLILEGHCDRVGTEEYNNALSNRRTRAVADAMVDHGVDRNRIEERGFGKNNQPIPNANTPEEDAQNRVVIIKRLAR